VRDLTVYPEHMKRNMEITLGLYGSQAVLLELTDRGMARKNAYEAVQRAAMRTWAEKIPLLKTLSEESEVIAHIPAGELEKICSPERHFAHVETRLRAMGIDV
jgi:adenylosuccinate lyase